MPDAGSLGPYPILQLTAAIIVLMGIGWAVYRGMRDKGTSSGEDESPAARWFFDGPLKKHLEISEECSNHMKEIKDVMLRNEREKFGEELRKQSALLERQIGATERLVTVLERRR